MSSSLRSFSVFSASLLPLLTLSSVHGTPVFLQKLELYTTHDLPFWTPKLYFKCVDEPKKYLTGVTSAHVLYNFTGHESFQPLTTLDVPQCKSCGLYEEDTWTEDDVFDLWELCPLDFTEPKDGSTLERLVEKEFNLTLVCKGCNTQNAFANGEIFSNDQNATTSSLIIFFTVLAIALGISGVVVLLAFWVKGGGWPFKKSVDADTSKFMQMFDEEDDDLLDDDDDIEMSHPRGGKAD